MPTVKDITTEAINGTGVFDIYMRAGLNQLMTQYDAGRIKGADFAAAYVAQVELMMTEANKFVLGLAQTQIAIAMFDQQYLGQAYDALAKESAAKKAKHESDLICQQVAELKANGASKRSLENAQRLAACEQIELYKAQAGGFEDKNRNDTFKTVMNAWAVHAVEVDPNVKVLTQLGNSEMNYAIADAKAKAGLR